MSRLRALLHVASPSNRNTQQPDPLHVAPTPATPNATVQQSPLHVAHPRECNTQKPSDAQVQRLGPEVFSFAPPNDPESDTEALEERIALMVEGGMSDAEARQEAVWQADRERAWRAFLRNAQRVLSAPGPKREAMLALYQAEAIRKYGERTGTDMALSLVSWVRARRVH